VWLGECNLSHNNNFRKKFPGVIQKGSGKREGGGYIRGERKRKVNVSLGILLGVPLGDLGGEGGHSNVLL